MGSVKIVVLGVILSLLNSTNSHAQTLYLSVAASMTNAFKEIITQFSADYPDIIIYPNFASSGALAKQIYQGAPADIYISANPKWLNYLKQNKMIGDSVSRIVAYNKLVFVGPQATYAKNLDSIVALGRIAIGTPQNVPAGQYAQQAMEAAGIYTTLVKGKKLVMAKDVRQALLYADRGEVDGAFVYITDALLANTAKILFTVPDDMYSRVSYPIALTAAGAEKQEATLFYDFVKTREVTEILQRFGFEPVE